MNSKTQELTYGAMLIALFGVLLLFNRQTAGLFEEFFFFILPVPMAVFSLKYGWRDGLPVFVCMSALSFFFGTLYTIFYAVTETFLGLILGARLRSGKNLTHTQLLVMMLSALFSIIDTVVISAMFGLNVNVQVQEMQTMMTQMFAQAGMDMSMVSAMLSADSLRRMLILSMAFLGIIQGFVIFRLCLLIMRYLRLPVPDPQPVGSVAPPKYTGYIALFLLFLYTWSMAHPLGSEPVQTLVQTAGLCGYLYLLVFGWIAVSLFSRRLVKEKLFRFLFLVLAFFVMFIFPYLMLILGFAYISLHLRENLLYGR